MVYGVGKVLTSILAILFSIFLPVGCSHVRQVHIITVCESVAIMSHGLLACLQVHTLALLLYGTSAFGVAIAMKLLL